MEVLCPKWSHDAASGVLVISGVKMADMKRFARKCNHCGKLFNEGYCIEGGEEYYCSKQCLSTQYIDQEFETLYDDGNGDSYYTCWECIDDYQYYEDGSEVE